MTITDYMTAEGIGFLEFSVRLHGKTGLLITPETLRRIAQKQTGCRLATAKAIIAATDGKVALEDLPNEGQDTGTGA